MSGGYEGGAVGELLNPPTALQQATTTIDSAAFQSPLPGGVSTVVRTLLNTVPPWMQIGGAALGALLGAALLFFLWKRRSAIIAWLAARNRAQKIGLAAAALLVFAAASAFGAATWNYTKHANEFCSGCHVMNQAFHRFASPQNKHAELSCHDCHQQSLYASARQLYLWVAERPEDIGTHAPVPDRICVACHVTADTARWQRVASTAGHRVHVESDSSALGELLCVTCHGVEVHEFRPVSETCGSSGCHDPEHTTIVLGRMADQTARHCSSCHGFTADVPALATRDSAAGTLRPGRIQCLGCHEMQSVLPDFDHALDPHSGQCGLCHNPHTQQTPAAAAATCAECHDDWRNEPFHTGVNHRGVGSQCLTCHIPHQAKVDASGCQECHEAVRSRGSRRPPVRFDTSAALRRGRGGVGTSGPPSPRVHSWLPAANHRGDPFARTSAPDEPTPPDDHPPEPFASGVFVSQVPPVRRDTFPHARHVSIACLVCHQTGGGHGRLTFEPPRGCAICHHQAPAQSRCETCHRPVEYEAPKQQILAITVPGQPARERPVDFLHERHASRQCLECHTEPVTLAPLVAATCRSCHEEHHTADRQCSVCHQVASPAAAHSTPETAHQRCDACHTSTTIDRLTPTRTFCETCHAPQRANHYEPRECTVCHFLEEPAVYRARLHGGRER